MPPHHTPHLIIDNTHRVVAPVDYDRRPQHETEEERLYTGDEVVIAAFFGGLIGSLIVCTTAWIVAGMPV